MSDKTYKIVRFYAPELDKPNEKPNRVMRKNLTLKQAQDHYNDESTRKAGIYFDGYEEE